MPLDKTTVEKNLRTDVASVSTHLAHHYNATAQSYLQILGPYSYIAR